MGCIFWFLFASGIFEEEYYTMDGTESCVSECMLVGETQVDGFDEKGT